ncbi:MAG: ferrous iron transport protein B [Anaerolineae bacterium]
MTGGGHCAPPQGSSLHTHPHDKTLPPEERVITVALAGQPNVGKSTVFNMLTGLSQHVGNWPGKTIEQKTGTYQHNDTTVRLVDLPGIYSLTANSPEEQIARDFIIREHPDVVIAIVNAATLERSLYLVAELVWLPVPIVLGLNMVDVAEREGYRVEPHVLEAALGLPVVPIVATRNQGIHELVEAVDELVRDPLRYTPRRPEIREDHRAVLAEIETLIAGSVPPPYPADWVALKLLEGDSEITAMIQTQLSPERWDQVHHILKQHEDAILAVAGGRYEWIARMIRAAVEQPRVGQVTLTDRLDRVATHPFLGLLVLVGILGLVFWLTYTIASPVQGWLDTYLVQGGAALVRGALAGAPPGLVGLLTDGVIGGVGTVITFLPILIIFFAILGLLEDVGYMARAAYVMDRFMHTMGLHGKSFLPLFLGFGCNVPAVAGTRIIDSPGARLLTIQLAPLVPCTARMAVVAFLTPAFFGRRAALVAWGLVLLNLIVLALAGVVANRLFFKGTQAAFIMELPLYHIPNGRTIGLFVWNSVTAFLRKAGSIILIISVIVWALSVFPGPGIENSVMGWLGVVLAPVGQLIGLDWQPMVALVTSFAAKENAIATLGVLYGTGGEGVGLGESVAASITPAAALAFLAVTMLFIPCAATLATIRQETGGWRWALFNVGLLLAISLGVGILIYQGAAWIGWGV